MPETDDAPPELIELAMRHLEGEEVILSWEHKGKHSNARLIKRTLLEKCRESAGRFHMGGGCGRTLEFFHRDGVWELVDKGGWIS
jgi:hypothetical protein